MNKNLILICLVLIVSPNLSSSPIKDTNKQDLEKNYEFDFHNFKKEYQNWLDLLRQNGADSSFITLAEENLVLVEKNYNNKDYVSKLDNYFFGKTIKTKHIKFDCKTKIGNRENINLEDIRYFLKDFKLTIN